MDALEIYRAAEAELEPKAVALSGAVLNTLVEVASISVAISTKRAADALQKLAGEGQGGWSLADLAGLIAERRGQ